MWHIYKIHPHSDVQWIDHMLADKGSASATVWYNDWINKDKCLDSCMLCNITIFLYPTLPEKSFFSVLVGLWHPCTPLRISLTIRYTSVHMNYNQGKRIFGCDTLVRINEIGEPFGRMNWFGIKIVDTDFKSKITKSLKHIRQLVIINAWQCEHVKTPLKLRMKDILWGVVPIWCLWNEFFVHKCVWPALKISTHCIKITYMTSFRNIII